MVWSDEFDVDGLPDASKWSYDVGGNGWGNNEEQFYTENRAENARVENGVLIIEALKESFQGREYTSARLVSRGKGDWTYGRIEARAKLPVGRGTWPAIWMLPTDWIYGNGSWPDNGEIDIMEHVGFDPGRVHGTIHNNVFNGLIGTQQGASLVLADAQTAFHTYAVEWTPLKLDFFVDDVLYYTFTNRETGWTTWPFDQDFHLLLNIAIGGTWGGQQGIDDAIFPTRMEVDYVRVFADPQAAPTVALTSPTVGTTVQEGETLTLTADATDNGGIQKVAFFQGEGLLGIDTEAPYELAIADVAPGCYTLTAKATDDQGWFDISDPVDLMVGSDCGQAPYLIVATPIPGEVEAEYFDLGGAGVGYSDLDAQNTGGAIREDEGVDIEWTQDTGGGYNVGWISNREWLEYTVDVKQAGRYTIDTRVASESSGGAFKLEFDGVDKTGTLTFNATGDWQQWDIVRATDVMLDAGGAKATPADARQWFQCKQNGLPARECNGCRRGRGAHNVHPVAELPQPLQSRHNHRIRAGRGDLRDTGCFQRLWAKGRNPGRAPAGPRSPPGRRRRPCAAEWSLFLPPHHADLPAHPPDDVGEIMLVK